jgi:polysaccharide biosynthesis protein PslG
MVCPGQASCLRLVSSEWGYSAWGGEWTAERQADYVLRSYLLNLLAGVPVSILYDWQDDGPLPDDKEANFGLLDHQGGPKPAFRALRGLVQELRGLRLMGRLQLPGPHAVVLAFGDGVRPIKLVGWSDAGDRDAVIPRGACITPGFSPHGRKSAGCLSAPSALPVNVSMRLTPRPSVADLPPASL